MKPLLEIRDYRLAFDGFDGTAAVLDGINLKLQAGDTLGIVGETGCGKSVLARSLLGLNPMPPARVVSGQILFRDQDILRLPESAMRRLRGRAISMVFQDPASYLNPLLAVGTQMEDAIRGQDRAVGGKMRPRAAARTLAAELLAAVGLPEPSRLLESHPHMLSGGMRQRVLIAMALAGDPALLVADEPTTALDVTVQGQILELIADLVQERGMALLLISHDLGVIAQTVSRMLVMYGGMVMESGPTAKVFEAMAHPYTRGLFGARPQLGAPRGTRLLTIEGSVPELVDLPPGCPFAERCPVAMQHCAQTRPPVSTLGPGHLASCLRHGAAEPAALP